MTKKEKDVAKKLVKDGKGFFGEFKKFITRGNVIDLAVGIIIGGAFQKIVNSLVQDIVNPVIGLLLKGISLDEKFFVLGEVKYATLAEATEAGAAVLKYGTFIGNIINFLIMAFVIFIIVRALNRFSELTKKKEEEKPAPVVTKICPFCKSEINIDAVRCPNCTSELDEKELAK
ncbi:MAG: large conductance mechanosensitive channel protein MscL [Clostridiales bacterium]|jgi:large conductance mechanosensitive channel|nr:large conductance mechanosensitive channel protein MscL [Clostridiales bacterium]